MTATERIAFLERHELAEDPADMATVWRFVGSCCRGPFDQWDGENFVPADEPPPLTGPDDYQASMAVVGPAELADRIEKNVKRSLLAAMARSLVLLIRSGQPFAVDRLRFYRYTEDGGVKLLCRMTVRPAKNEDKF